MSGGASFPAYGKPDLTGAYACACDDAGLELMARFVAVRIVDVIGPLVLLSHVQSGLGNRALAVLLFANEQAAGRFVDHAAQAAIEGRGR